MAKSSEEERGWGGALTQKGKEKQMKRVKNQSHITSSPGSVSSAQFPEQERSGTASVRRSVQFPEQKHSTASVRRSVLQAEEQQWHLKDSQMNLAREAEGNEVTTEEALLSEHTLHSGDFCSRLAFSLPETTEVCTDTPPGPPP